MKWEWEITEKVVTRTFEARDSENKHTIKEDKDLDLAVALATLCVPFKCISGQT